MISQSSPANAAALGLGRAQPVDPVALCLGPEQGADPAALGYSLSRGLAALGLSHVALWSPVLGLWVEQLASAPDAHPPEVSGAGAPPGFQVLAPSPLICVHATGLQVSARAAYPPFTVQGQRGEGRQRPWLQRRVL